MFFIAFFPIPFIEFFGSRICFVLFFFFFFYDFYLFEKIFLSCFFFFKDFILLSFWVYLELIFFKTDIVNSLSSRSQPSVPLRLVIGEFCVSHSFMLLLLHLKQQTPHSSLSVVFRRGLLLMVLPSRVLSGLVCAQLLFLLPLVASFLSIYAFLGS